MTTAQTILEQLGGSRFVAMTGARNLLATDKGLQFKIGRGATNKATNVRVTLDASDTYTVEFFAVRGLDVRKVSEHALVYADGLRRLFTAETGMQTGL